MKKTLYIILAIMLLAVPAAFAIKSHAESSAQASKSKNTVTVVYKVNMHCENCVEKLTDKLSFLKGMEDLKITLGQQTVVMTYDPAKTNEANLVKAIEKCGYTAEKVDLQPQK
ncbi:MAG: heavy-metal-associated domain-containing protein [Bacteroidales bacterium]|nr:heavy-metal-associated domain-containing protein [Bacteroidales bacterium]